MSEELNTHPLFYLKEKKRLYGIETFDGEVKLVRNEIEVVPEGIKTLDLGNQPEYFNNDIIVIDSVKSGTGRDDSSDIYKKILLPIFNDINVHHQHVGTTSENSIKEFGRGLSIKGDSVTLIFISGDTSVNEFVNSLPINKNLVKVNILVIPAGTGNSLALSLGFLDVYQAIGTFFSSSAEINSLNLYEAQFPKGSYYLVEDQKKDEVPESLMFIVVLSWAFHASLVADSDTPKLRKHGVERFKIAAYSNLSSEQKYEGIATFNGIKKEGPFAYFVLTPSNRFEKTFVVLPKGNILDDNLYLIAFNSEDDNTGKYIMNIMGEIYDNGKHVENSKVTYEKISRGNTVVLETKNSAALRQRRFCVDGSIIALPEKDTHLIKVTSSGNTFRNWSINVIC